jgi:peptidoglycan/LPS O-acetylase OafA/YrhL
VAIVCVLSNHAEGTRGFPFHWALDGSLGVRIFFIISGFIITWLMLQEEHRSGAVSLKGFYRRRAARILPAYWIYLLVIATLGAFKFFLFNFAGDILRPLTFSLGLTCWPPHIAWQVAHTWSLAIEEQFYLIWPLLFVLLPKQLRVYAPVAVVIAGPISRCLIYLYPTHWGLNWTIVGNADMLAWGGLLALLRAAHPNVLTKIISWRPALARLVAIIVVQFAPWYCWRAFVKNEPWLSTNALSYSVQSMAIAYLIASLIEIRSGWLYRFLNLPVIIAVGVLSYSLYLWQQLFFDGGNALGFANRWPINLVCVFAAATASYFVIERPSRLLLRGRDPMN